MRGLKPLGMRSRIACASSNRPRTHAPYSRANAHPTPCETRGSAGTCAAYASPASHSPQTKYARRAARRPIRAASARPARRAEASASSSSGMLRRARCRTASRRRRRAGRRRGRRRRGRRARRRARRPRAPPLGVTRLRVRVRERRARQATEPMRRARHLERAGRDVDAGARIAVRDLPAAQRRQAAGRPVGIAGERPPTRTRRGSCRSRRRTRRCASIASSAITSMGSIDRAAQARWASRAAVVSPASTSRAAAYCRIDSSMR